jgi:hypothetical protein
VTAIASVLPVASRSELSDVPVIELAAVTGSAVRS